MQFERYREIMKTHGITELIFLYDDTEYIIFTDIDWDDLSYFISLRVQDKMFPSFSNFDEFVTSNFFNGKSLTDIWNDIEIVLIDGMRESEYDPNEDSFNFVEWKESMGNIQWEHSVVPMRSFLISLRYVLLGAIPIPALSILFPLLGLANWTIVIFFSSFALLPFLTYSIWFVKHKDYLGYHYKITTKKIIVDKGFSSVTDYNNVKKIKLKKSIIKKKHGTIKIYVKKGLSINYHIEGIPDAEKVYRLILDNKNQNN